MITAISDIRPNRITSVKDERYHNQWARYGLGAWYNNPVHQAWLLRTLRNERFYLNDQWWMKEDVETFLGDESGEVRNRINVTINMIRGLVDTYRGNAIEMVIGANCESISPMAITRKEKSLAEALFHSDVATKVPVFKEAIKKGRPVGDSREETIQIHENLYVDGLVAAMNDLLTFGSKLNDFQGMLPTLAEQMGLSGMAVTMNFEYAGHHRFEVIQSKDFFWDRGARKYDLSDAGGGGYIPYWSPTQVYEMCPNLTEEQKKMIETYDQRTSAQGTSFTFQDGTRTGIPAPFVWWRDTEPMEYGYVKNEYGDVVFHRINFKFDNEEKVKYTDADLVTPPDTLEAKALMDGGKMKCTKYPDVVRYCQFIPWQAAPEKGKKNIPDTVIKYGLLPFQETNAEDYNSSLSPFKVGFWSYLNGDVHSPVDDAIDPQRFMNRALSVMEQQINNSGGTGPIIDSSVFDSKDEERDASQNMDAGKPVYIKGKGRGVQNLVTTYDRTMKAGSLGLFNLIEGMKGVISTSTGQNEAMRGELQGDRQGAKVTELMIQRGSVVQQPFYYALEKLMLQNYQAIATRGKRIYIQNQRKLVLAVGDEPARIITLSKEHNLEDFRVFVKSTKSYEMMVETGNALLKELYLEMQVIDKATYADLYGRSTPDRIAQALRKLVKTETELGRMQAKAQAEQQAQQAEAMQALIEKQDQKELAERADKNMDADKKAANKTNDIIVKEQAKATFNPKN